MSFVQETLEKRLLSSCQNVWFCYCTEINIVIYVLYTKQRICGQWAVPGVGNCLFLRARGWGIDRQVRTTSRLLKLINLWNKGNKRLFKHPSYSLPRYFWPQKTEVKPEFSKKLDEVFPRSNRRYNLRFHCGSIAENAPILSSGSVQ